MKNIVWLASYPKSGNTWCRVFLANLSSKTDEPIDLNHLGIGNIFSSRTIIEEQTGYDISEFSADECDELRSYAFEKLAELSNNELFVKTHDAYLPMASGENLFPLNATKAAVYFIRNPFDLAVSFANHLSRTTDDTILKMCDSTFVLSASIKKFNPQVRQRLLSWSGHVDSWKNQTDFPVLFIRYEDLVINSENEFRRMLEFLNIRYSEKKFQQALVCSQFENLQKLEQDSGFKEKPVDCMRFFNMGTVGYFRNYLSKKAIETLINKHSETMTNFKYLDESGNILI
jgi:hypothetical protein